MLTHLLSHGALLTSVFFLKCDSISLDKLHLQLVGSGVVGVWWVAFGLLLNNGEEGYWRTFFSTATAKQFLKKMFQTGGDETRSIIIRKHESLWEPFKEDIVAWLAEGWQSWENDKPAWFTTEWKATLPEDMTPGEEDVTTGGGRAAATTAAATAATAAAATATASATAALATATPALSSPTPPPTPKGKPNEKKSIQPRRRKSSIQVIQGAIEEGLKDAA